MGVDEALGQGPLCRTEPPGRVRIVLLIAELVVPAVLGYNWLVRRNKVTMESVRRFGADLHGVLMGARLKAAPAQTR